MADDPENVEALLEQVLSGFRAPPKLLMSEWADRYRNIISTLTPWPGRWQTSRVPYMREIMDAFCDPEVPGVAAMLARQMGKTESLILNAIGYFIHLNPTGIMVVQPTTEDIKEFSSVRITGLIEDCPEVRSRVADPRSRDGLNSTLYKKIHGGFIKCTSTGSYRALVGRPVRIILMDEVDAYEMLAQGHPIDVMRPMMSNFWNAKEAMLSTPLNEETSVIWAQYSGEIKNPDGTIRYKSSMGEWFVPCPQCDHRQVMSWDRIQFNSVTHTCESCGRDFSESKWKASQINGEHRHRHPEVKYRGYHVSALVSPWVKWQKLIDEFLEAKEFEKRHDYEKLKGFNNRRLALPWKGSGEKIDHLELYGRREVYGAEVPDGVCLLVATVDPGKGYMDWEVSGWGFNGERWGIETGTLTGDEHLPEIWASLEQDVLSRSWERADGRRMKLTKMLVDSGWVKRVTCQWTKTHQPIANAIFAIGREGLAMVHTDGYTKKENARIWTLGSWELKDATVGYLRVKDPGPAYWHYPMKEGGFPDHGYDLRYFQQLCNEKSILKFSREGYSHYRWEKVEKRAHVNEAFDLACYSVAAKEILGIKAIENAYNALHTQQQTSGPSPFGQARVKEPEQNRPPIIHTQRPLKPMSDVDLLNSMFGKV